VGIVERSTISRAVAITALASLVAVGLSTSAEAAATQRWSVTVASASALTGPELGGGRVYVGFTTANGKGGVRALNVGTGATLWTRNLPLPVTAAPAFSSGSGVVYAGTGEHVYALDPSSGAIVSTGTIDGFGEDLRTLEAADGQVYAETLHDIFAFNAALLQQWDYFLDDDPSLISAPGDGFLYLNDEDQVGSSAFPQCMEKVDATTGTQAARNCKVDDFIEPTAVPQKNSVVGAGSAGVFNFRPSNLGIKWTNASLPNLATATATVDAGGRVAAAGGTTYALLRTSDGHQLCQHAFGGKQFGFLDPVFRPGTAVTYVADVAGKSVLKVSASCGAVWTYGAGADVIGLRASTSTVVGTAATKVFALEA
jgi:outer membrane protein assembly factor BamB